MDEKKANIILTFTAAMTALVCMYEVFLFGVLNVESFAVADIWMSISIFLLWHWIYYDAGRNHFHRPYSFGLQLNVFWFVLIPAYFVETRGKKGLGVLFGLFFLWVSPAVFSALAAVAFGTYS